MSRLGSMLVALGFLSSAYMASLDAVQVRWPVFLPLVLAGFLGVYLRRRAAVQHAQSDHVLASNRASLEQSLARIVAGLAQLDEGKQDLPPHRARFEIDRLFREDLTAFADARESLSHMYGLQAYADVMSAFAAGERYLNRVWSASADGYVDEVREYIGRALSMFREAQSTLDEIQARHAGDAGATLSPTTGARP